ncbi:MAG: SGNH/GDSL hydrolase family protein [Planctomycetales bacterium]|nr:SGNH/GDSL hydrolase family protein [Planctomycetales bacterium]
MTTRHNRRSFLSISAAGAAASFVSSSASAADSAAIHWNDVRDWGVEGRGFDDTEKYFDRLPGRAKGVVRDAVWNLSRNSAGMMVRFRTDATEIHVNYSVTSSNLAMPHMPATGVSGLDLYAKDEAGNWKWVAVCKPTAQEMKTSLVKGLRPGKRDYAIYLPLYNGTESLNIGVDASSSFEPIAPRKEKPIVFYGTSITHGACASRPGMPHPSILGRRLDRPVINLGFSGNGKLETSVGQFLVELDPCVYVLDCLPNMVAAEVTERTEPMVRQLRSAHPNVPIVLVEDRSYSGSWLLASQETRNKSSREAFKAAYAQMLDAGIENLFYVDGESLLAENRDDTTDGSHPSDLGFFNQANAMEPAIRQAIGA